MLYESGKIVGINDESQPMWDAFWSRSLALTGTTMATYKQIARTASTIAGVTSVKTCWIADVMSDLGLTTRRSHNRIDPNIRTHPCPDSKRAAILEALRRHGMT